MFDVRRRALTAVAAVTAVVAVVGPAIADPSATTSSRPCGGAVLPTGYAVTATGRPYEIHTPYSPRTLYNATNIAHFVITALGHPNGNTADQMTCLAVLGGRALLSGSSTRGVPYAVPPRTARWFPYQFPFSANPLLPRLQVGWVSGLAQGAALHALGALYQRTRNTTWQSAADETFESFTVPYADGGFVTTDSHGTWFQEYPTSPPTYVLNGHMSATLDLASWYRMSGDPRALALFEAGAASTAKEVPAYAVDTSQGAASIYDTTRWRAGAHLRAATGGHLTVLNAAVVDEQGQTVEPLTLPVGRPPVAQPSLLVNGRFRQWSGAVPTGWTRTGTVASALGRDGSTGMRVTTVGSTVAQGVRQTIPATRLTQGAWYRVSWTAYEVPPSGSAGTSGQVRAVAMCADGEHVLGAHSSIRGGQSAQYDLLVRLPAKKRCDLRITLGEVDPTNRGTAIHYDNVTVGLPAFAQGPAPRYPLSVADSRAIVRLTYTGSGELQAWDNGRWFLVAGLSAATVPTVVDVVVPTRFTGVDIHLGYHEIHVGELAALYSQSGIPALRDYAQRWLPLAPSMNGYLSRLTLNLLTPSAPGAPQIEPPRRDDPTQPDEPWLAPIFPTANEATANEATGD